MQLVRILKFTNWGNDFMESVLYDFLIKRCSSSSSCLQNVCSCLIYVICVCLYIVVCFLFRLSSSCVLCAQMMPVSLDCPLLFPLGCSLTFICYNVMILTHCYIHYTDRYASILDFKCNRKEHRDLSFENLLVRKGTKWQKSVGIHVQ